MILAIVAGFVWYNLLTYESASDCLDENLEQIELGLPTLDCY